MPSDRPWMESLVACIPDPVALLNADGSILWANRELSRMVGTRQGLKGHSPSRFIEDWAMHLDHFASLTVESPRIVIAAAVLREDGMRINVQLHVARCHAEVGAAWSMLVRDVQELSDLRHRLSERERSHSFLQANTSDLIVRTDQDLRVTWRNENAATLFPEGELLGGFVAPESLAPFAPAPGEEPKNRFDVFFQSPEHTRPSFFLRGIARRLFDDHGVAIGFSLILGDDSERFRLSRFCATHSLSAREEEIVEYLVKGYSNLNIASILGLSESGVKFHIRNVFSRAKVGTRTELMALLLSD